MHKLQPDFGNVDDSAPISETTLILRHSSGSSDNSSNHHLMDGAKLDLAMIWI